MSTIAVDARKLRDGGIGTYIRELLAAFVAQPSGHRFVALVDPADRGATGMKELPVRAGKYSLEEHWVVAQAARRAGADLLHAPHYTLPLGWRGPAVVTIHDLIHVRWSRLFPPGAGLYARTIAGMAARRARVVIADSAHTRREVLELLGIPESKVRVVPLGVSSALRRRAAAEVDAFRARRRLPADYVLYVGARRRHKNLELLLRAIASIPKGDRPPLVLSGDRGARTDALATLAQALGIEGGVAFSGPLGGDEDLALLYSGAVLYVQPSLDEGFGLPPLEAMACGVPVLSSTGGSLAEVLDTAAVFLPPDDAVQWGHSIAALVADRSQRAALAARGVEHAARFEWRRTAEAVLEAYEDALRETPRG